MNPIFKVSQLVKTWVLEVLIHFNLFDFLGLVIHHLVDSRRNNRTVKADSCNLGPKEMFLLSREMRVGDHLGFKISGEDIFNFFCLNDVFREGIGQFSPIS